MIERQASPTETWVLIAWLRGEPVVPANIRR
jgi:hypothetical protein